MKALKCTRCQRRSPKSGKLCDRCRSYDIARRNAVESLAKAEKARVAARLAAIRETMTPVFVSDGTSVGFDGFTNIKKKRDGWRCKGCGAKCSKRECFICERLVK